MRCSAMIPYKSVLKVYIILYAKPPECPTGQTVHILLMTRCRRSRLKFKLKFSIRTYII